MRQTRRTTSCTPSHVVEDITVITGSFNLFNDACHAENTILVRCPAMAYTYHDWIKSLSTRYERGREGCSWHDQADRARKPDPLCAAQAAVAAKLRTL